MNQKQFDEGYQKGIEIIKQYLSGKLRIEPSKDKDKGGIEIDLPIPPPPGGGRSDGKGGGSKGGDVDKKTSKLNGAMIDRETGKKIAKAEGYDDSEGNDEKLARDWKEAAIKNASKLQGKNAGSLISKILGASRTTTDWKKELKNIVGRSLHPEEKDYRFTNKNILVSQDRISRTDKDKYNNVDSIFAFIDASGSMTDDLLQKVLSEVLTLALQKKPSKLVVVQCDTRIVDIKEYTNIADIKRDFKKLSVKGRGGTELKPCWDLLRKDKKYNKKSTELVLVFTDGYLTQYPRDKKTMQNLCWCIIDNPNFEVENKESFTKCIYFDTKQM